MIRPFMSHRQPMKTSRKLCACLLLMMAAFGLPGLGKTDQRSIYEQARHDISQGNWARAEQKLSALKGYPLQGYLRWALLRKKPSQFEHESVKQWLADIDGQVLAGRVRHSWLMHLAANKRWKEFLEVYRDDFGVGLRCDYVAALHHEGQLKAAERWARKLWLNGRHRHIFCFFNFRHYEPGPLLGQSCLECRIQPLQVGDRGPCA